MIYNPADIESAGSLEYDLCIIGSGLAGLTVCAEMLYSGLRICVVESGFFDSLHDASPLTDNLRAVETAGIDIPRATYERVVGGATKAWDGICAPMDPIDFEKRPFPYHNGWPIAHADILPYLSVAAERYYFPPVEAFERGEGRGLSWQKLEEKTYLRQRMPIRMGREFRYIFERKNVDLFLETTVVAFHSSRDGFLRKATSVECKTRDNKTVRIVSGRFVLATGGIENPRILLNSKEDGMSAGLGNEHDQVGRYLMNHLGGDVGIINFKDAQSGWKGFLNISLQAFEKRIGLRTAESLQKEQELLNCSLELIPVFPWQNKLNARANMLIAGILTYLRTVKRAVRDRTDVTPAVRGFPAFLLILCKALPYTLLVPWYLAQRLRFKIRPYVKKARVHCTLEMEPLPENRVMLGSRSDAYGIPTPLVVHKASERDVTSAEKLLKLFSEEYSRLGIGDFVPESRNLPALFMSNNATSHMGTTRMGTTPATSVVDADLRVHSVSNLYVTGTSVFPTCGSANPAMTVAALSIRLAEHLQKTPAHTEAQVPAHEEISTAQEAIIIGAGRRITDDVVPAFEASEDCYKISRIFARTRTALFGRKRPYDVLPFTGITPADVAKANLIYIAVPVKGISDILKSLTSHPCSHIDLVVDTPAVSSGYMQECYKKFRSVHVAEDSVFLPWLDVVRKELNKDGLIGALKKIVIDRSAYRYHGIALVKTLCSLGAAKPGPFQIRAGIRFMHHSYLICRNHIYTIITGPYLKKDGSLRLVGTNGNASDKAGKGIHAIECVADGSLCRGFRLGASMAELADLESDLVGRWEPTSSILTHMQGFKRVGLSRLLRAVRHGENAWRLSDGLNDMRITRLLERIGMFANFP